MTDYICPQCSQETEPGELLEAEVIDNEFIYWHEACWQYKQQKEA